MTSEVGRKLCSNNQDLIGYVLGFTQSFGIMQRVNMLFGTQLPVTGDFYTPISDRDKKRVIKCTENTILVFNGQNLLEESVESTLNLPAIMSHKLHFICRLGL